MGFIIINDQHTYATANWAYDLTLEAVVAALPETPEGQALANWLLNQRSEVVGLGMGSIDMRDLSLTEQTLLKAGIRDGFMRQRVQGGAHWHQPEYFEGWLAEFENLVSMMGSLEGAQPAHCKL